MTLTRNLKEKQVRGLIDTRKEALAADFRLSMKPGRRC
jgi:hypothetical protein